MSRLAPVEAPTGDTPLGLLGGAVGPSGNYRKRILFWNGWSIPPGVLCACALKLALEAFRVEDRQ